MIVESYMCHLPQLRSAIRVCTMRMDIYLRLLSSYCSKDYPKSNTSSPSKSDQKSLLPSHTRKIPLTNLPPHPPHTPPSPFQPSRSNLIPHPPQQRLRLPILLAPIRFRIRQPTEFPLINLRHPPGALRFGIFEKLLILLETSAARLGRVEIGPDTGE